MRKQARIGAAVFLLCAALAGAVWYWIESGAVRETDNAYVNADVLQIASQINGQVSKLYVSEGQAVVAGQTLFEVDPAPFSLALSSAQAKLQQAEQSTREDQTAVAADEATVMQIEADLASTRSAFERTHKLVEHNFISKQAEDDAATKVQIAQASLDQARAKLAGARLHAAALGPATPAVLAARAAVDQARLDLAHTHIVAPKAGWIANLTLVQGAMVSANAPLFALVSRGSFWVDANFKETELPGIQTGQPADIDIDMQPGQHFHGVVSAIGGGTGAAFSLLPAQNASGNWVKVTQRVPVRVHFAGRDAEQQFRIGASARVLIHVKER